MTTTKKIGITAGVLAILLGVFGLVSFSSAGRVASEYEAAFKAWNSSEKPKMLAAVAAQPEKMYVFEFNDITSVEGLSAQKKGCDATEATLARLRESSKKLPSLPAAFLGTQNEAYLKASKQAEARKQVVDAYTEKAVKTFEGLVADCQWNYGYNKGATASHQVYAQVEAAMMKPGESAGGRSCPASAASGCVPVTTEQRAQYAEQMKKYIEARGVNITKWYNDKLCKQTAYGEQGCKALLDAENAYQSATIAYADTIATQPADSPDVKPKTEARVAASKAASTKTADRFAELFPGKNIAQFVSGDNYGSDALMDAVHKASLAELTPAAQPLTQLQ